MQLLTEPQLMAEGEAIGRSLPRRAVVTLEGELGSGKTTLVRAIVRGLGAGDPVSSPTYQLVHRYPGPRGPVFHVDCYRLRHPEEARDLDWETLLGEGDAVLVEWPERASGWVPPPTLRVRLHHVERADQRGLELSRCG